MSDNHAVRVRVFSAVRSLLEDPSAEVSEDTPLIGDESSLVSMKLVELCLALEDMASEIGFDFDWTSEVAMSKSRSLFRTAGSLADEFLSQMEEKA